MKTIRPADYDKLTPKEKFCYKPQYVGYKKKKIRDYSNCRECGHSEFLGWKEISTPIGDPISYNLWKPGMMDWLNYDYSRRLVSNFDKSVKSFTQADSGGETIRIPFIKKK